MNIRKTLEQRISRALQTAGAADAPALVVPSGRPEFGDYQANGCMAAAKKMKTNPVEFAKAVLEKLDLSDLAEKVEIKGPGFINIFLKREWLDDQLGSMKADEKLSVSQPETPETVVVDYSGPNLAKEMHVGHLRSTIIGDALARTLQFIGYKVIRQNHVGDWGTQFGMLAAFLALQYSIKQTENGLFFEAVSHIKDLDGYYKLANEWFKSSEENQQKSRDFVVRLQSGDPEIVPYWKEFCNLSLSHARTIYGRLGVLLGKNDVRGESLYNDYLPQVVKTLDEKGLLKESEGAKGVFLNEFKNKDGDPFFMIVQKSDGGYLYATTDLAAIWFRCGKGKEDGTVDWTAGRVLYVTDSRQAQHFAQVFTVAKKAGFADRTWLGHLAQASQGHPAPVQEAKTTGGTPVARLDETSKPQVSLEHVPFGMMLGTDGRPFKTREGGTVKLMDLLDEAESRAGALVKEKNPDLSEDKVKDIAHKVGIGALKYADLSQNRTSDYVFSWDKMLSLEGNTAPYMQYAYARIQSIFRKQDETSPACQGGDDADNGAIHVSEPAERALAVKLLQFPETVESVAEACMPNILCAYLYELAGAFMSFYENCPVLKSEGAVRASRLALCRLTAMVIQQGLALLGIETLEQM
ncbi:MAG: arginine--tRNA ligase [Phycisphaerae bacterium]|nr:arginine--tRNA ligase [Phycisphaerae bacterium]